MEHDLLLHYIHHKDILAIIEMEGHLSAALVVVLASSGTLQSHQPATIVSLNRLGFLYVKIVNFSGV